MVQEGTALHVAAQYPCHIVIVVPPPHHQKWSLSAARYSPLPKEGTVIWGPLLLA